MVSLASGHRVNSILMDLHRALLLSSEAGLSGVCGTARMSRSPCSWVADLVHVPERAATLF